MGIKTLVNLGADAAFLELIVGFLGRTGCLGFMGVPNGDFRVALGRDNLMLVFELTVTCGGVLS